MAQASSTSLSLHAVPDLSSELSSSSSSDLLAPQTLLRRASALEPRLLDISIDLTITTIVPVYVEVGTIFTTCRDSIVVAEVEVAAAVPLLQALYDDANPLLEQYGDNCGCTVLVEEEVSLDVL